MKLRTRLLGFSLGALALMGLVFAALAAVIEWSVFPWMREQLQRKTLAWASTLAREAEIAVATEDPTLAAEVTRHIRLDEDLLGLSIRGLTGKPLYSTGATLKPPEVVEPGSFVRGRNALYATAPVEIEGQRLGVVQVAFSARPLLEVRKAVLAVGVVGLALWLLTVWGAVQHSRAFVAPILRMIGLSRSLAAGDYGRHIDTTAPGELAELASHLDRMGRTLAVREAELLKRQEALAESNRRLSESLRTIEEKQHQLAQAQKMAAVGQLAGGIAHEINNPMGVILGFAQSVQRRMPQDDPDRLPIDSIVREAVRCKNLVRELLVFSRSGKRTEERVDLNSVVKSSAVIVEARAKTQGTRVEQRLEGELPSITGNPVQLEQVVVNLLTNALDATEKGGGVMMTTRSDGDRVLLEVLDTGVGIPDEVLPQIFVPFFTTKEVGKGTGLGLSLSHEIVQQHGGRIAARSEVGKGTVIAVDLPIANGGVRPEAVGVRSEQPSPAVPAATGSTGAPKV